MEGVMKDGVEVGCGRQSVSGQPDDSGAFR